VSAAHSAVANQLSAARSPTPITTVTWDAAGTIALPDFVKAGQAPRLALPPGNLDTELTPKLVALSSARLEH
jgi:hypothetical protein